MIEAHIKRFYFVGLAGAGMSSIACVLARFGYKVMGWDDAPNAHVLDLLRQEGIEHEHWSACDPVDCVVYSTAISHEHPALAWARGQLLPLYHRSDILAWLSQQIPTIAVCGSHGKTTTTSMVHHLLDHAEIPHVVILGGILKGSIGGHADKRPEYLVIEACESDRSFLKYHPKYVIMTNLAADHLEYYHGDLEELIRTFAAWLNEHQPHLFWACDQSTLQKLRSLVTLPHAHAVGPTWDAEYHWSCRLTGLSVELCLTHAQKTHSLTLPAPGVFNAANAALAMAVSDILGADVWTDPDLFTRYKRVDRRFEYQWVKTQIGGMHWIHDYGHHPNEIKAIVETVRALWPDTCIRMVFEPHRFTRLHALMAEFAEVLKSVDLVVLLPIYSASEAAIPGVTSDRLSELTGAHCTVVEHADLSAHLETWPQEGIWIFQGAGHVYHHAHTWLKLHEH